MSAIAATLGTLYLNEMQKHSLALRIAELQSEKTLATASQADYRDMKSQEINELRRSFKAEFEGNPEYVGKYKDYTELPEYKEELARIEAKFEDLYDEIQAWEDELDSETTTCSAQLELINAYKDSFSGWVSSGIQGDYNYGQG